MKSLLLTMVFTSCYAVFFTIIFRKNEIVEKAAYMTIIFLLSIPFYAFAHWALPVNLGFLPTFLSGSDGWPDLIFGLLIYVAGYFGGVLQLYNLADRGLSLRMLIDMAEASKNGMTAKDLFAGYSNGKGIEWMYQKRLSDLKSRGLVAAHEKQISITNRGSQVVLLFDHLRKFLRI